MAEVLFHAELQQVRHAIDRSAGAGKAFQFKRCATERMVTAWENRYGFPLPEQYRMFLRKFGNGGMMPGSYCDFILDPLAELQGRKTAAASFPITAERLRDRLQKVRVKGRLTLSVLFSEGLLFPELAPHWQTSECPPGCVVIGAFPSTDRIILVTTGDLRGSVWCVVNAGMPEVDETRKPLGFLRWFAETVVGVLDPPD